jgi:hypothetical protein
MEGVA